MKLAFVIQYYPYQYDQLKSLIDYLKADLFYTTPQDRSKRGLFDIEGNRVDLDYLSNYDALIFNHPYAKYFTKMRMKTKSKIACQITHSLLGTRYDIACCSSFEDPFIGSLMPRSFYDVGAWNKWFLFSHHYYPETATVKSNPICQRFNFTEKMPIKKGSIGVILGEISPVSGLLSDVEILDTYYNFREITLRVHPLHSKLVKDALKEVDSIHGKKIILDNYPERTDADKFVLTKEYLVGGSSSLLIEASLMSRLLHNDQKIFLHRCRRELNLGRLKEFDRRDLTFSLDRDTDLYSPFLQISDINEDHERAIYDLLNRNYSRKHYEWLQYKHLFKQSELPETVL